MTEEKRTFVRKYLTVTAVAVLVLIALIILRRGSSERIETAEERIAYLALLGWECDMASEEARDVKLPESFAGVMEDYNSMQIRNGYDMSPYAGRTCQQYIYVLTEHPGSLTVYAVLYVYDGKVIGGDIHTAVLDGYMHGLRESR